MNSGRLGVKLASMTIMTLLAAQLQPPRFARVKIIPKCPSMIIGGRSMPKGGRPAGGAVPPTITKNITDWDSGTRVGVRRMERFAE